MRFGEFLSEDMVSPRKARQGFKIAKKTISTQRRKIKTLHPYNKQEGD